MSSFRSSSRYNSFDNRSSTQSDPSSSADLSKIHLSQTKNRRQSPDVSYALAKTKSTTNEQNLSAMVKKFMEKRSTKAKGREFVVAADVISDDFRKKAIIRGGTTGFGGLHKKLFGSNKGKGSDESERGKKKALTEVKPSANANARTLAMVLRSERELLTMNKDQETEITDLKLMLAEKNREVDKLKDLCLKQREEIKALKSAILFPETHAQESIPSLQRQVKSLTGQLHCLAQDLAEVKADKYSLVGSGSYDISSSPTTPTRHQAQQEEEATNSLEFSSGSPDDMFLNDLNPCLTPYAKSSKEFAAHYKTSNELGFGSHGRKVLKSSGNKSHEKKHNLW